MDPLRRHGRRHGKRWHQPARGSLQYFHRMFLSVSSARIFFFSFLTNQTEEDFAQIAGAGLNWIRLPIAFWAIDTWVGEPFLPKVSWKYALKAFDWAPKYGLRKLLEIHSCPGSQNG